MASFRLILRLKKIVAKGGEEEIRGRRSWEEEEKGRERQEEEKSTDFS